MTRPEDFTLEALAAASEDRRKLCLAILGKDAPPPQLLAAAVEAATPSIREALVQIMRERDPSLVYFIQSARGPIKIGRAIDPEKRLLDLQIANAELLTLLCSTPGGSALERRYHKRFGAHRIRGEWFEPHKSIRREIAKLQARTTAG